VTAPGHEPAELSDGGEQLFRHVHPSWVRDGQPTSQAFKPTAKDDGRLSVSRGSLGTAEQAFRLQTERLRLTVEGTWAVTVAEVAAEPVPLYAFGDPVEEHGPDPAHAYVDFSAQSRKQVEVKARLLLVAARTRGRLDPSE